MYRRFLGDTTKQKDPVVRTGAWSLSGDLIIATRNLDAPSCVPVNGAAIPGPLVAGTPNGIW